MNLILHTAASNASTPNNIWLVIRIIATSSNSSKLVDELVGGHQRVGPQMYLVFRLFVLRSIHNHSFMVYHFRDIARVRVQTGPWILSHHWADSRSIWGLLQLLEQAILARYDSLIPCHSSISDHKTILSLYLIVSFLVALEDGPHG